MAFRAEHVFRWDLDKTYLKSEFDSVRDLVSAALESAQDKQAFPGARALLRSLSRNHGYRICIVSGSPTQMRRVLAAKLALDGIEYSEFVLKNNLRNLARDVLAEEATKSPMAKKVHESFTKFQAEFSPWAEITDGAYHQLVRG